MLGVAPGALVRAPNLVPHGCNLGNKGMAAGVLLPTAPLSPFLPNSCRVRYRGGVPKPRRSPTNQSGKVPDGMSCVVDRQRS